MASLQEGRGVSTTDWAGEKDTGDIELLATTAGRTIRATQTVTDPRQIVDYSDVDMGGYAD